MVQSGIPELWEREDEWLQNSDHTSKWRQSAYKLLKALGIPYDMNITEGPAWDGKILRSDHISTHYLAHEAAHWLVAGEEFRKYRNYGCGADQDYGVPVKRIRSEVEADEDELLAADLGAMLGIRIGLNPKLCLDSVQINGFSKKRMLPLDKLKILPAYLPLECLPLVKVPTSGWEVPFVMLANGMSLKELQ